MRQDACSFAGHQPSKLPYGFEEDHPDCVRLKLMLGMEIESMIARGCTTFYSGMTWGAGIWCAEMVLNLKRAFPDRLIRLSAVLPYEEHHAGWTKDYQERYFSLMEQADEIVTLYPRCTEGCGPERYRYMIDRSQHLIAVFGGEAGGTKQAVEYAREKGRRVVLFDPVRLSREELPARRSLRRVK
jgi:uncharacterized phage-like protein YoqJ